MPAHPTDLKRIGLAIDAVATYGRGVIRGIMTFSRADPAWVITVEPLWSFGHLPAVNEWDVDGMIVQTFSSDFEQQVIDRKIPSVNVSNFASTPPRLPTVIPDDRLVGEMAADYLLSLGFKQFGFCWPADSSYGALRLVAFRERLRSRNFPVFECNTHQRDIGEWLAELPKPAAVLGCNDDWAHRILNIARRASIAVPDELSVLGVDNDELFNSLVTPSLSSVAIPCEQIGFRAAQLLNDIMNGAVPPAEPICLPPVRIVPRESTDALSVADSDVILASRYIRENRSRLIQVHDVVEHVPMSRRSLERRFRKYLGRSISGEIQHAHVEYAKQLLVETDLTIKQIAIASGFNSMTRLGIVFRRQVGTSPTDFRQKARVAAPTVQ